MMFESDGIYRTVGLIGIAPCRGRSWFISDDGARSGPPQSRRRTFTPALRASAHSMLPALRHPWLRWPATPAPVTWGTSPSTQNLECPLGGQPRAKAARSGRHNWSGRPARSGRRPRRVPDTRKASASCVALLGRPPPALEGPPSRRAATRHIRTQRPKAAPRAWPHRGSGRRLVDPPRAAAPLRPRSPGGATARPAGRTLAATTPGQACGGHGWPRRRKVSSD